MKRYEDFDFDMDDELTASEPEEKPFSFNDLDLGLDFDLSFLDDIEETIPEEKPEPKPEPVKPAPAKAEAPKPAPKAPARRPASPEATPAPKRPPVQASAGKPSAPAGQRPAAPNGQRPSGTPRPANAQRPPQRPANGQAPNPQRPVNASGNPAQHPAGAKAPAKRPPVPAEQPVVQKKKSGPRLGSVIFYTLYFMFILMFFLATFVALNGLHGWLANYELAQPGRQAEQVFTQLFTSPDWGALYDSAGAKDSAYEGKDAYVAYMEEKVGSTPLSYLETSAGLSGDKKYLVRLDKEKVASFTLVDKAANSKTSKLMDASWIPAWVKNMSRVPDWQLGTVEIFFDRTDVYYVVKLDGHDAFVNDVKLEDDTIIQVATTKAEEFLPEGTTGASMCTQQVDGLMATPVVTVFDKSGNQMEVSYDEATRTFTERLESNTMTDDQREAALTAAKTYCNWMLAVDNDRGNAAKILDPTGNAYKTLTKIPRDQLWVQDNNGFTLDNVDVSNFALYAGDIFSVRVTMDVNVSRTDGSIKSYPYNSSMFFRKNDSGKWMCFESTNVDVSQPVGRVRMTFMNGTTEVHSQFYDTDSKVIITPVVPVPDGKVFSGWATIETENGSTVYNLQFQPDAEGEVNLPEGTNLKPMTLYALFQNPSEQVEEGA